MQLCEHSLTVNLKENTDRYSLLPVVLERSFGFSPRLALILSACDSMQWMFWVSVEQE